MFLQSKHPNIRSQLLPVVVEYDAFLDRLIYFFNQMLDEKLSSSSQNLEVEIKLGQFFQREQQGYGAQDLLENFKIISQFGHTILDDYKTHYIFQPCFIWQPWSEFIFDTTANPQPFQNLKQYLLQLSDRDRVQTAEKQIHLLYVDPNNENFLTQSNGQIRLDINFTSGDRTSISLNHNQIKIETIRKRRKGDMDVMKGENQFRITAQIETITDQENFDRLVTRIQNGEQVNQIRLKSTMELRYQFFRVDMSRVYHISNDQVLPFIGKIDWNTLLIKLLKNLHDIQDTTYRIINPIPIMRKRDRVQASNRKCEIEFEICDIEYLKYNLEPSLRRLIRNVDSFFHIDRVHRDLMHYKISQKIPDISKQSWQPPLIGNYQYTIYKKNHHILMKTKQNNKF